MDTSIMETFYCEGGSFHNPCSTVFLIKVSFLFLLNWKLHKIFWVPFCSLADFSSLLLLMVAIIFQTPAHPTWQDCRRKKAVIDLTVATTTVIVVLAKKEPKRLSSKPWTYPTLQKSQFLVKKANYIPYIQFGAYVIFNSI